MTSEKHLEAIARLLARMMAGSPDTAHELIVWAYRCDPDEKLPKASAPKAIPDSDILEIYETYPAKDPANHGRVCRSSSDKKKIKSLLASGKETKESLTAKIRQELAERNSTGTFLRNLATLLNNLPDLESPQPHSQSPQSKYR